jgi:hypothetical protein
LATPVAAIQVSTNHLSPFTSPSPGVPLLLHAA